MAEIRKIKVNGTEYDVQPEWATHEDSTLTIVSPDYPAARIALGAEFGTSDTPGSISIGGTGAPDCVFVGSSASGTEITLEGASFTVWTNYTEIGYADGTVDLLGTVLVNHNPIAVGDLSWADYNIDTKALTIGVNANTVTIGTTGNLVKIGPSPGVDIEMGTGSATFFSCEMYLARDGVPEIWLGTHGGKISVGNADDGPTDARVLIGTDSISMGVTEYHMTLGTNSISMGTGGLSIGSRVISLGSGKITAGAACLDSTQITMGTAKMTSSGFEFGAVKIGKAGLDVNGYEGVYPGGPDGDETAVTLGTSVPSGGWCSVEVSAGSSKIRLGTSGGSVMQPLLWFNGVQWWYDSEAHTVTLTDEAGKSATIQLS